MKGLIAGLAVLADTASAEESVSKSYSACMAFRDANCGFYDDGGSAGQLAANECLLTQTARRASEL